MYAPNVVKTDRKTNKINKIQKVVLQPLTPPDVKEEDKFPKTSILSSRLIRPQSKKLSCYNISETSVVLQRLRTRFSQENKELPKVEIKESKGPASPMEENPATIQAPQKIKHHSPDKPYLPEIPEIAHVQYDQIIGMPSTLGTLLFTIGLCGSLKDFINWKLRKEKIIEKSDLLREGKLTAFEKNLDILSLLSAVNAELPFSNPKYNKQYVEALYDMVKSSIPNNQKKQMVMLSAIRLFLKVEKKRLKKQERIVSREIPTIATKKKAAKSSSIRHVKIND